MTCCGVAHVGDDREALAAGLLDPAQRLAGVARRPLVHADERALGREPHRGGLPDAVRGAGDQGHLADKPLLHVMPSEEDSGAGRGTASPAEAAHRLHVRGVGSGKRIPHRRAG